MKLIAFTGYAGCGKDEAAKPLIEAGYQRCCFGDVIKRQVDPLIQQHLGFSAFTEDRDQKTKIRRTLENWGEDNYEAITAEFFAGLPEKAVNTRLVRVSEGEAWRARGGIIIEIVRPEVRAASPWENGHLYQLRQRRLIDFTLTNDGTVERLHEKVKWFVDLWHPVSAVLQEIIHMAKQSEARATY